MPADKQAIHDVLVARLRAQLESGVPSARPSSSGEPTSSRPEDLASVIETLQRMRVRPAERVEYGALVRVVDEGGGERTFYLINAGAGEVLETDEGTVHVLTTHSPLGRALLGAEVGDLRRVRIAGKMQEYEVVEVE